MVKRKSTRPETIPVIAGGGNVFADLGVAAPEEGQTKAQLASHIRLLIRRRPMRARAARLTGIDQAHLSAVMDGQLGGITVDELLRVLTALSGPPRALDAGLAERVRALVGKVKVDLDAPLSPDDE